MIHISVALNRELDTQLTVELRTILTDSLITESDGIFKLPGLVGISYLVLGDGSQDHILVTAKAFSADGKYVGKQKMWTTAIETAFNKAASQSKPLYKSLRRKRIYTWAEIVENVNDSAFMVS